MPYIATRGHVHARSMSCCTQSEWALRHRTPPYIDARGPTATQVAVPYINVQNASTYGAVRKADASNARSKRASNLMHVISRDKFQPSLTTSWVCCFHCITCVLLEIVLNAGSVVLEGAATRCSGILSCGDRTPPYRPHRALHCISRPNARHVGPFYGASVYSCSL